MWGKGKPCVIPGRFACDHRMSLSCTFNVLIDKTRRKILADAMKLPAIDTYKQRP